MSAMGIHCAMARIHEGRFGMRLLTRSDFDGLVCAVLLVEKGVVDSYQFVHPKDVQDGAVTVTSKDVLANVPYASPCGLWFDHHASEEERLRAGVSFKGESRKAPSAAQVIWDYYGGRDTFGEKLEPLLEAVNKSDSGNLTKEDILNPQGWMLLAFVMDPRTGLGRFSDYRISNYKLMEDMIQYCRTMSAEEILALPDVKERTDRYLAEQEDFKEMLLDHSRVEKNLIITDLRGCETIHAGNRFMIYALFPEQNMDLRIMWGKERKNVVFSCGHSILNRTSRTNVGKLLVNLGGGGHETVGTCQVAIQNAERVQRVLIERITAEE